MKGYYQKKINSLEQALERKQREAGRERNARREAERYIYALLKQMGGHATVKVKELQYQPGRIICYVGKPGRIRMQIDDE